MPPAQSYKDLEVYRLAHELGVDIHHFTLTLPKYEMYECGSQMRRSSKSISANIAEGFGRRRYKAEFIRFLVYALASCNETTEWLEYSRDCHTSSEGTAIPLLMKVDELGRKLNRFLQVVISDHRSEK